MAELDLSTKTEASSGLNDLTQKQKDMAFARSPANNQAINLDSMQQKQGVVAPGAAAQEQQAQQGVGGLAAQQRTVQGQQSPQIAGLQANLGTFATKLQGSINKYLQGGVTADVNASLAEGSSPQYIDGKWVAPSAEVNSDLTGVLGEKLAQQQNVQAAATPFVGQNFENVLEKFADTDGNGILDAQEQAFLNQSFGIVNALRRLDQLDPYSPEAEALRMQLQLQDREGMVSGLQTAMDKYNAISGQHIAGAAGDDRTLENLINMSSTDVLSELQKATTGATGLFSGDAASSIKSSVDEAARQYSGAAQEEAGAMQAITDTTSKWLQDYESKLESSRSTINDMFLSSAQGISADLEAEKAAAALRGEDTKWIDQAKQWFTDLQTGVKDGSRNFSDVLQQLLASDSGMAPEAKATLKKWLGQTIGEDTQSQGELATLLKQVTDQGYALTQDENGNTKRINFTSSDKQQIAGILADDGLDATQKQDAIQAIIADKSGALGQDLAKDTKQVTDLITDGQFKNAMSTFRTSMVESLKSFKNAAVKDVYNQIIASGVDPTTMGAEGVQATITQRADEQLKAVNTAADVASKQIQTVIDSTTKDKQEIQGMLTTFGPIYTAGVTNIRNGIDNAISSKMPQYASLIEDVWTKAGWPKMAPADLQDRAAVYSFIQYLKAARGTPLYSVMKQQYGAVVDTIIDNPRIVFKQTPADANNYAIASQLAKGIPYEQLFRSTEAFRQIDSKQTQLTAKLKEATLTGDLAASSLLSLKSDLLKAQVDIKGITSATPLQMFMAAKTGNTKLLSPKFSNATPADFAKMGYEVSYNEDQTQGIDFNVAYTPVDVKGDTAMEILKNTSIAPAPTPAATGGQKEYRSPAIPKGTDYRFEVTTQSGKKIIFQIPGDQDPHDYIQERLADQDQDPVVSVDRAEKTNIPGYAAVRNALASWFPKLVTPMPDVSVPSGPMVEKPVVTRMGTGGRNEGMTASQERSSGQGQAAGQRRGA